MSSKAISASQWKLFNFIRHYLPKISKEKAIQNALGKQFARLLQKCQPSVYGSDLSKMIDVSIANPNTVEKNAIKAEEKSDVGSSLTSVLTGLKIKIGMEESQTPKKIVEPKWKTQALVISMTEINAKTRQILTSISLAESTESKLRRVEDLSAHLQQYPGAKSYAVKEGALRLVLKIRQQRLGSQYLTGAINEVCALLGYANPPTGRGIRILAIDGGGIRGILVLEMLKKLEELTGQRVHEMFDYICGVSTGAIVACSLGDVQITCDELLQNYIKISTEIFTQSALKGTSSLVWNHSYYNTELWEKLLKQQLGEGSLISTNRKPKCPKIATVSAVVNQERASAYVFRNYALPWRVTSQYVGGFNHKVWEATRASASAPTYFEECRLGNLLHQDGGILVNNPTALAIHEAKLLWPGNEIQCVLSFGTGRIEPNPIDERLLEVDGKQVPAHVTSWRDKFMRILDSATDTEGVHTTLSDLLPANTYFRFNPYLTEMLGMSEIKPEKLDQLKRDALMYIRRNEDKFQEAAKALMQKRTYFQKARDCVHLQAELLGFTSKL